MIVPTIYHDAMILECILILQSLLYPLIPKEAIYDFVINFVVETGPQ